MQGDNIAPPTSKLMDGSRNWINPQCLQYNRIHLRIVPTKDSYWITCSQLAQVLKPFFFVFFESKHSQPRKIDKPLVLKTPHYRKDGIMHIFIFREDVVALKRAV